MTEGQRYIKESFVKELDYEDAITQSKNELLEMNITDRSQIYDNESIFDSPIYPANAVLYDEFCDECGFDTLEYFLFIARRIEQY